VKEEAKEKFAAQAVKNNNKRSAFVARLY